MRFVETERDGAVLTKDITRVFTEGNKSYIEVTSGKIYQICLSLHNEIRYQSPTNLISLVDVDLNNEVWVNPDHIVRVDATDRELEDNCIVATVSLIDKSTISIKCSRTGGDEDLGVSFC